VAPSCGIMGPATIRALEFLSGIYPAAVTDGFNEASNRLGTLLILKWVGPCRHLLVSAAETERFIAGKLFSGARALHQSCTIISCR